jgi:hypothetical protein
MLDALFSVSNLILCVLVYLSVLAARRLLEALRPSLKASKVWRDGVLSLLPLVLGGAITALGFPVPLELGGSYVARLAFGAALGGLSGQVYRAARAALKARLGGAQAPRKPAASTPDEAQAKPEDNAPR